jgi:hypothetical protein
MLRGFHRPASLRVNQSEPAALTTASSFVRILSPWLIRF